MKIAVCSDLHLEFGPISLENTDNAEVLILSGDICVAKDLRENDSYNIRGENDKSNQYHTFFQECCARFPSVIYIAGNHEHYHGDFAKSIGSIRDNLGYLANLHILDRESVLINGVMFIGGTLWTDMNKEDGITLMHMKSMMNDFRCVTNSARESYYRDADGNSHVRTARFTPDDAVEEHKKMLDYLKVMIEGKHDQKFVVVGHHAPSKASTHPRYANETIMNGGYSSDLSEFILDHPQIKLWTHGHTHENFDYLIGSTRIVCNPRGYINYEASADNFTLKTVEI
jgi:Icc-related predicted phosphoesterase